MRKLKPILVWCLLVLIASRALSHLRSGNGNILGLFSDKPPTISFVTPGKRVVLPGAKWTPQTLNNCAPAAVSMLLQYFGYSEGQEQIRKVLRTNPNDSNVFSYEVSHFLKSKYGLESKIMFNGNTAMLKTLIANGFYIMIEDWLRPNEDIGHNTIIRGYDDNLEIFIADDPYLGRGATYKYSDFDSGQWKPFNREYMPVYKKDRENLLKAIIGENWDPIVMYRNSVKFNNQEAIKNPNDVYHWFNLGTSYFALGEYAKAKTSFEKAKSIGWPPRMLWYQYQPVQTYNQLGEFTKALELAHSGLKSNDSFAELHFESAVAYKGLGNITKARDEVQKALKYYPGFEPAKSLSKILF